MYQPQTTFAANVPPPWPPAIIVLPPHLQLLQVRGKLLKALADGGKYDSEELAEMVGSTKLLVERALGGLVKGGILKKFRKRRNGKDRYLYTKIISPQHL